MRRVRRYAVGLARRRTPACHRSRPTGFPRGPSHRVAARRRPACPSRGSTIPRPALNATISSVAPGAARWVSPAAALCTPRRRGRGCSRSRRRGCSRFEAEPIQRRHMALDPLHLDALFGCPPPSGSERLVDRVDRGDGPPALGEIDGVAARAAAYVERATGHRGIRAVEQMSPCVGNVPSLPGSEPQLVQQRVGEHPVTSKRSTIVTGDCCTQHACQPGEGEVLEREHPTPRLMRLSAIRRQSGYSPRRGLSTATATSHDQPVHLGSGRVPRPVVGCDRGADSRMLYGGCGSGSRFRARG